MIPLDIAIDVSHAQGAVDWPAVAAAGIRIAMLKASESIGFRDPLFDTNAKAAAAAGLAIIPYHFLRPGLPEAQARHFATIAGLEPGMAFALDWEGRASLTCTPADAERAGAILAEIAGRVPLGYWGIPGSSPAAPTARMRQWERWVPRYPVTGVNRWASLPPATQHSPEHWWKLDAAATGRATAGLPRFGQYTAWGRVAGIKTVVDRSVAFFRDEAQALAWCAGAPAAAPSAGQAMQGTNPSATPVAKTGKNAPAATAEALAAKS